MLADPRVLILDDATSSVDPTKEHEIRSALAEVMQGRTTIIIAHRPATIALADRVVLLDGGRVVADGPHERLLETSQRYREVLARAAAETDAGVVDDEDARRRAGGELTNGLVGRQRSRGDALARRGVARDPPAAAHAASRSAALIARRRRSC